jgi:hypothetical protein
MQSAGVWSLSREEIEAQALTCWEDQEPATEHSPANPAHAVIDYSPHDAKAQKKIGKLLKKHAIQRGRAHP